jgi:hypothetical protein
MTRINDINDLQEMAWAFRESRVLMLSHKLDIYTILSKGPMNSMELSKVCKSDRDMTDRLLIACFSLGLLNCKKEMYENTELSSKYLVRGEPHYQGGWIDHAADDLWDYWGKGIEKEIGGQMIGVKDWSRRFALAMHGIAMSGEAGELAQTVDLKGRRQLVDVGGGPGTYSIFLCKKNPGLKAVVFDLPKTIEVTMEVINEFKMNDWVATRAGDWAKEGFGHDNDVVLMSNILHGAGNDAEMKLEKAFKSLKSGGLLIVRDFVFNDEKTGPKSAALFNLMVGAYTISEISDLIRDAGFQNPREVKIHQETHSTILADKP